MAPSTDPNDIKFAIPKGRMYDGAAKLLIDIGAGVNASTRDYRPVFPLPGFKVKILKPRSIVEMLATGARDMWFAGADWVAEDSADPPLSRPETNTQTGSVLGRQVNGVAVTAALCPDG